MGQPWPVTIRIHNRVMGNLDNQGKNPNKSRFMENHIKLTSGFSSNSYIRQFQVAQLNFYLFSQEEKTSKKRYRVKNPDLKAG